jgi:dTDP-D-glucose 4,6-dehydratase
VFNIACGCQHSLNRLYEMLAVLIGYKEPPRYARPRLGDIAHSQADISAATQHLGYRPELSFEEGLSRTVQWYRESLFGSALEESGTRDRNGATSPLASAELPEPLYEAPLLTVPITP